MDKNILIVLHPASPKYYNNDLFHENNYAHTSFSLLGASRLTLITICSRTKRKIYKNINFHEQETPGNGYTNIRDNKTQLEIMK